MIPLAICGLGVFFDLVSIWRAESVDPEDRGKNSFLGVVLYAGAFVLNRSVGRLGTALLTWKLLLSLLAFAAVCQGIIVWRARRRRD